MKERIESPSREEIWKMFDQISSSYDRINRVMTFGLDQMWRKRLCNFLPPHKGLHILDCATGTGDQIIALLDKNSHIESILGIDLSEAMVAIARKKIHTKKYKDKVTFRIESALDTHLADESFDCITISFGIRNVTDVMGAFKELKRVLKPGGRILILEGTLPSQRWLRTLHLFYLRKFIPYVGGLLSKNLNAYRYLNKTIESFPQGERLCALMRAAGFVKVKATPLCGGVVTVYQGDRDVLD